MAVRLGAAVLHCCKGKEGKERPIEQESAFHVRVTEISRQINERRIIQRRTITPSSTIFCRSSAACVWLIQLG